MKRNKRTLGSMNHQLLCLAIILGVAGNVSRASDLRIGIIGLDTSHVINFTKLINDTADKNHVPGGKVVVGYKGGSPDNEASAKHLEDYTHQLQDKFGVKMVDSIEELCAQVDAVLLEGVDGRPHLEHARPVIKARKPVFIDKPIAGSLRDAIELVRLAKESKVPVFSSSAYRFYDSMTELKKANVGQIRGAISYGPSAFEPHHPDFFWYGIHPVEALFTVLGTGCESVTRVTAEDTDVVAGKWSGGRSGAFYALRTGSYAHKVTVFGTKGIAEQKSAGDSYGPLVGEIVKFFQTGVAPVKLEETLEIIAFMEAADESKRQGGLPVKISDVLKKNGWKP